MATRTRIIGFPTVAELAAALVLAASAVLAHHQASGGSFYFSDVSENGGDFSIDLGGPLVFLLWALAATALVRGLVLLFGDFRLDSER